MRESIFFNKQQIKLIRSYGIIYRVIFDYGVWLFSAIFSIVSVRGIVASGYFSSLYLRDPIDMNAAKIQLDKELREKTTIIKSLSGLSSSFLLGPIKIRETRLLSQDNLLSYSGFTFPRLVNLDIQYLSKIAKLYNKSQWVNQDFLTFFTQVITTPLRQGNLSFKSIEKKKLEWKSLKEYFGLACLDSEKRFSPVCGIYVQDFFQNVYALNLASRASDSSDSVAGDQFGAMMGLSELENEFFAEMMGFVSPLDEYFELYQQLNGNLKLSSEFCSVSMRYLQYGGETDYRFDEMFRRCGDQQYKNYIALRDFMKLTRGISLGYADNSSYSSTALNTYKLYSLQQLLYRTMQTEERLVILFQTYFAFLQDLLQKESRSNIELLPQFSKEFTYWFHTKILAPYLREHSEKLTAEERSALTTKLMLVNNGDRSRNMKGLLERKDISIAKEETNSGLDIEALFRANLPKQFALLHLKKIDDRHLEIDGRDQKTSLRLQVQLAFDGVQFMVEQVKIDQNKALQDFVNPLLKLESYSLLKMLDLLEENKNLAVNTAPIAFDLCKLAQDKYEKSLLNCSNTELQLQQGGEKENEVGIRYTFNLKDDVIVGVKVSDPELELALLKTLDFSKFRKDSTLLTIDRILAFKPEKQASEFGLKEQLLVNDRFNKYLQLKPTKVDINGGEVKVFFEVAGIKFIGNYDVVTDILAPIALDFGESRSPLVFQRFQLVFKEDQQENLTRFLVDPVAYLRGINPRLTDKYFKEGKLVFEENNPATNK